MIKPFNSKNVLRGAALLISIYFPPEPGGAATAAWNRASILRKIGYNTFVLCGFPSYPVGRVSDAKYKHKIFYVEKKEKFTLLRLRLVPLKSKGYFRRLILFINFILLSLIWMPKILSIVKPELIYAMTPTLFSSIIGDWYSKAAKSFFIYESTDLWPEQLVAIKSTFSFLLNYFGRILAMVSYNLPDMIIVTSTLASEYVVNKYHPKAFVYALPLGIDFGIYNLTSKESSKIELIERKIIPKQLAKKFIVLYAGTLNKVTRVESLFFAAKKLSDVENDIIFLVVGEGDEKEKLEEMKINDELNNLIMLPFPPRMFVPQIISAADVCIVTLSPEPAYYATIPTKFFDYLACHKPQIGICEGELAHLINTNKIGATVKDGEINNLANTIVRFRESPQLLENMKNNAIVVSEKFSLETLAHKLQNVLEEKLNIK